MAATLALLRDLPPAGYGGPRIRVVGRVIALDLEQHSLMIQDENTALIVDLAPIHDDAAWAPKLKDLIMVAGDLCLDNSVKVNVAVILQTASTPQLDDSRVLRAVWVKPCEDLDLPQWRTAVLATLA
ncbi:hypothetical protein RQP46_008857 [Phenoliferia psychrophenolica]